MTSNVTLCAPFRNNGLTLPWFVACVNTLTHPRDNLRVICVEGDSTDDTWEQLHRWAVADSRVTLVTCNTGRPKYPSIVHPERFALLARVFNTGLEAVDLEWSDYVLFTPSDVLFQPDTLARLLAHGKDMIAPFFWSRHGKFYDTWGHTRQGRSFDGCDRDQVEALFGTQPIEMETVGGMVLMRSNVLRAGCRYTRDEVDRGLCKCARECGYSVWADPTTHIRHM